LFDGETTFGWSREGETAFKDGMLTLGGEKAATIKTATTFGHCSLKFESVGRGESTVTVNGHEFLYSQESETGWSTHTFDVQSLGPPVLHRHEEVMGRDIKTRRDRNAQPVSPTEVRIAVPAGSWLRLHSIKLKPEGSTVLFNGKDLTGWKEFKPTKDKKVASKFTVIPEGWLSVKNGPGDLQTEGQWADFVVQFECVSNGKHLNSGLFFRCVPDLYQQGYEAQIRNEWMGDDRTKPVDFGTGAIYRRQAARKVVSTDGEWFTMTVAAHGRHFATWVNGYQVTDWTDDRKESDNARNGFKKGKGALSIQGHDPTTDLSFRNIRIQSLDSK